MNALSMIAIKTVAATTTMCLSAGRLNSISKTKPEICIPGERQTAVNGKGAIAITGQRKLARCARRDVSASIAPILWRTKNVTQNTFRFMPVFNSKNLARTERISGSCQRFLTMYATCVRIAAVYIHELIPVALP